jgi:UDP-2,3-diacylglucosamine hydrolase
VNSRGATFFISDIHLSPRQPRITRAFLAFLAQLAACRLFVLGDLFDYWAGDDDLQDPFNRQITAALAALRQQDVQLTILPGNRDFLMRADFARAAGAILETDPLCMDLDGQRVLLSHGDSFCTADPEYQSFRQTVRDPQWQRQFLARPLAERRDQIEKLRQSSEQAKSEKPAWLMDVTPEAIEAVLREYGFPRLMIHGHIHRPGHYRHTVDGHECDRHVLPAWEDQPCGLVFTPDGGVMSFGV